MLHVNRETVLGELAAMNKVAEALRESINVLQHCRNRLDTMKDGPVLRDAKDELRRLANRIRSLSDHMQGLNAQAREALDILMDCEYGIRMLNEELKVGELRREAPAGSLRSSAGHSARPLLTVPDDRFRLQAPVYPDWLKRAARDYFSGNP